MSTARLVAAAIAAAALLGESGCTHPDGSRASARPTGSPSHGTGATFVGGAAAGAAAAHDRRAQGDGNGSESSDDAHANGFGDAGSAHGSGG